MYSNSNDDWKTDEMVRADRLDETLGTATSEDEPAAVDPSVAARTRTFRAYAMRHSASPAWQALVEKVDRGELTWQAIGNGEAMSDPAVQAAIAEDRVRRGVAEPAGVEPNATSAYDDDDDEDEDTYYGDFAVYRDRKR
jgi:hypothetical protein